MRGARRGRPTFLSVALILVLGALATLAGLELGEGHSEHGKAAAIPAPIVRHRSAKARLRPAAAPVRNVYAYARTGMMSLAAARARQLVYVPNSGADSVDVIDPRVYRVVGHFPVGALPQHITPAHDLRTLYVNDDAGNTLTPIDPRTGEAGTPFQVDDPYNLYFTLDGRFAIVVAERLHRLDFRSAQTFRPVRELNVPCAGVNHLDFSADGRYAIASCEFSGQLLKVDIRRQRVIAVTTVPRRNSVPQDVRAAPNAKLFYVADLAAGGVWKVDPNRFKVVGLIRTGAGAHGLVVARNGKTLYVTNRNEGSVSVISFRKQKVIRKWWIPHGGSPDMGDVSADGRVLWVSGRYNSEVYALSTRTGRLLARVPVGASPHGLCVWPQPGRYSLGHTGNMR
jgi:DNA-binding beta-propeller fold protein YncE